MDDDEDLSGEAAELDAYVTEEANLIVMHLCQNVFDLELDHVVLGDLTECNFDGYEAQRMEDWIDVPSGDPDLAETVSEFVEFEVEDIAADQICTGVYVTIKEGTGAVRLLDLQVFDVPIVFTTKGQILRRRYRMMSAAGLA